MAKELGFDFGFWFIHISVTDDDRRFIYLSPDEVKEYVDVSLK